MSATRVTREQESALARAHLGLDGPVAATWPDGTELRDAEGALLARVTQGTVRHVDTPRWPAPDAVRAQVGWADPVGWLGYPPHDVAQLPAQVVALLPTGGLELTDVGTSQVAAAWARVRAAGRAVVVVPVPVDSGAPAPDALSDVYGIRLLGTTPATTAPTGGRVLLFTGLSGAGKSTVARRVVELLVERGSAVTLLDGDEVRTHLSAGLGFSRADRDTNVRRIGWVAAQVAKHGGVAVCAPIAPYESVREEVRAVVDAAAGPGSLVLVHVATSLAECERRDRKGLYAKARRGEIAEFTGISDPYEEPVAPQVRLETQGRPVDDCAREVLRACE